MGEKMGEMLKGQVVRVRKKMGEMLESKAVKTRENGIFRI